MADPIEDGGSFPLVDEAYSPALFGELSQVWQKSLTDHLQNMLSGDSSVLNWQEPAAAVAMAESFLSDNNAMPGTARRTQFAALLSHILASGQNLHNPRYIGHQVPASVPVAGLFDAIGSITNQPMAIYEMGPWATAVERALVRRLCGKVGWNPDDSGGLLTHGGSLANLTALLTARNVVLPRSWEDGVPQNAVLIAQADAHYCVTRSAGILGLGTRQIISAVLDDRRRMDPERLDESIRACQSSGKTVIAVVAAACATPIGAFDPLDLIADVCERHGVWLHVDAAHGGGVLMSAAHRGLLKGIERADSVVWDAHKMLFVPALCAAVLYRNKAHRFSAFQQDAPYLFDPSNPGMAEYDSGMCTVECTKRSTGFGLWGLWSMFGEQVFEQMVDRTFALAAYVHQLIDQSGDFESCHVPQCNIVVFRHIPAVLQTASQEQQNQFLLQIRTRLIRSREFYIVQTKLDGRVSLRLTVMNPTTRKSDLELLVIRIRQLGEQILDE